MVRSFTSICMCAMSFACAKAIRASICRRAWCVKKLLSLGSVGGPSDNVDGRSTIEKNYHKNLTNQFFLTFLAFRRHRLDNREWSRVVWIVVEARGAMRHQAARPRNILPSIHALRELGTRFTVGTFAIRRRFVHEANLQILAYIEMQNVPS